MKFVAFFHEKPPLCLKHSTIFTYLVINLMELSWTTSDQVVQKWSLSHFFKKNHAFHKVNLFHLPRCLNIPPLFLNIMNVTCYEFETLFRIHTTWETREKVVIKYVFQHEGSSSNWRYLIFIQNYFKRLRSLSEHYNRINVNHT